jgi:hypothetical protein
MFAVNVNDERKARGLREIINILQPCVEREK